MSRSLKPDWLWIYSEGSNSGIKDKNQCLGEIESDKKQRDDELQEDVEEYIVGDKNASLIDYDNIVVNENYIQVGEPTVCKVGEVGEPSVCIGEGLGEPEERKSGGVRLASWLLKFSEDKLSVANIYEKGQVCSDGLLQQATANRGPVNVHYDLPSLNQEANSCEGTNEQKTIKMLLKTLDDEVKVKANEKKVLEKIIEENNKKIMNQAKELSKLNLKHSNCKKVNTNVMARVLVLENNLSKKDSEINVKVIELELANKAKTELVYERENLNRRCEMLEKDLKERDQKLVDNYEKQATEKKVLEKTIEEKNRKIRNQAKELSKLNFNSKSELIFERENLYRRCEILEKDLKERDEELVNQRIEIIEINCNINNRLIKEKEHLYKRVRSLEKDLEDKKENIEKLSTELDYIIFKSKESVLVKRVDNLQKTLDNNDLIINRQEREIELANTKKVELTKERENLVKRVQILEKNLADKNHKIGNQRNELYKLNKQNDKKRGDILATKENLSYERSHKSKTTQQIDKRSQSNKRKAEIKDNFNLSNKRNKVN